MIDAKHLMRLHVEALFTRDDAGRLLTVNEPSGAAAPRFFLGRTVDANLCWFRHDVDAAFLNDLHALCESQARGLEVAAGIGNAAPFIARLAREEPVRHTWAGPAFHFPPDLSRDELTVQGTSDNATLWARTVRAMNRLPLYSTSWENESSRALARKLGLIQFGSDLHIT